ncbi:hypothetical protein RDABS01_010393 [Bienertia sinuspersici]
MDFHCLKRKELQEKCKKYGIPANLKNSEMADRLSALFQEEKPTKRGRSCMKDLSVVNDEEEMESKDGKRVKFSPQNETFVFEKTDPRELRLLARKKRSFQKSKIEEKPVSKIGDIVKNVDIVEKEKPVERNLRRRSVVVKPDRISDSQIADNVANPIDRNLRRKTAVCKTDQMPNSKIVDNEEKPVEKINLRRRSVVVKSEPTIVVERNLRRRSVVVKSDSKTDDAVERKTVVSKVEKPVERNLRRRSAVGKGVNVDPKSRSRGKKMKQVSIQDALLLPCVEKKDQQMVGQGASEGVHKSPNKMVTRRQLKSTEVVAEVLGKGDDFAGVLERDKLAEISQGRESLRQEKNVRTRTRCSVIAAKERKYDNVLEEKAVMGNVKDKSPEINKVRKTPARDSGTPAKEQMNDDVVEQVIEETVQERSSEVVPKIGRKKQATSKKQEIKELAIKIKEDVNDTISESQGLEKTNANVGPEVLGVVSRQEGICMVEASSSEQVVGDDKDHQIPNHMDLGDHEMAAQCVNEQEAIGHSTGYSAPPGSLSDCREYIVDGKCEARTNEQCHATEHSISVELKAKFFEEVTGKFPNSTEKMNVMSSTISSEECKEETEIINKIHENALGAPQTSINDSSLFKNSGNGEPESPTQADKVEEASSNYDNVADKNSYDDAASTPHSIPKVQLFDTLFNSSAEQNCVGESFYHRTMKPSMPGSSAVIDCGQQSSSSSDKFEDEMWNRKTFESSAGLNYNGQSSDKQLIQEESWCEKPPCLSSLPQIGNVVEDKLIDGVAVIAVEADVQSTEQDKAAQSWVSCDRISRELEQTTHVFSVDKQSSHINSQENVVLVPEASMEINVQSPVVEGHTLFLNASAATKSDIFEEGKDIITVTSLNRDSNSSDAEDFHLAQSLNKDDGSVENREESCKETSDVAGLESSIQVNNFADEGEYDDIVNQLDEFNVKDAMSNFNAREELQDEKAESVTKQDAFGLSIGFQQRKWSQVNVCPDVLGITHNTTSDEAKYLKQNFIDAAEASKGELTVLSGLITEESHKETPSTDLTCFANDGHVETVENDNYITVIHQDEVNRFNEPEFKHHVSRNDNVDCANDPQSKGLESENVDWTTEDIFAFSEDVENSVLFQKRKPVDLSYESTLHYGAHCSTVLDSNKDLQCMCIKDDDANINGGNNVINLQYQVGEPVETTKSDDAKSSAKFKSSSNEVFENILNKEAFDPVSELRIHLKDDETSVDLQSNSCSILVEAMENQTTKLSHAEDSSPSSLQGKTDINFDFGKAYSVEKEMDTKTQNKGNVEEAGESMWRNDSPESAVRNDLDKAPNQAFCQQTRSIEGATREGASSSKKDSSESVSIRELGEPVKRGPDMQSCLLADISEKGKSDGGDEVVEAVDADLNVGQVKDSNNCVNLFEMTKMTGSPERNSGKFSLNDTASGLNSDAGSSVICCPPSMDRKSTCYSTTCEIASDSLHTSHQNICNDALRNGLFLKEAFMIVALIAGCIEVAEGVHSSKAILLKDDQNNEVKPGDMVEPDPENLDVLPSDPAMSNNIQALVCEIADGPESIAGENQVECTGTKAMELEGLTSPFSVVNWKLEGAKGNYEADTAELRDSVFSAMVESHSFGEFEKGVSDVQGALKSAPEIKVDYHLKADSEKKENVNEEQIEDASTNGFDFSAPSGFKDFLQFDFGEASEVQAEAELEFNADKGKCMLGEQIINQEQVDEDTDPTYKDCYLTEEDHLALERPGNFESWPREYLFKEGQDNEGDLMEHAAENSNVLPSESAVPDNIIPQTIIPDIDGASESIADKNLVEYADAKVMDCEGLTRSPFSVVNWKLGGVKGNYEADTAEMRDSVYSAVVKFDSLAEEKGVIDNEGASESAPEVQTDNHLNAANRRGRESLNKKQVDDAGMIGNDDFASSRSDDVLPLEFVEVSGDNTILKKCSSELEFDDDEGNCIFGKQVINHEHAKDNIDTIDEVACMTEEDHSALERPGNLESSPCANYLMDFSLEHIVHSESRSADGKDDIANIGMTSNPPICEINGVIFDPPEEKVIDCSVGDVAISKSMKEQDGVAAYHFVKPSSAMTLGREGNDSDSSDNKADAGFPSTYVGENITGQLSEQSHIPLMLSCDQQMDPTESACQTGIITTALLDDTVSTRESAAEKILDTEDCTSRELKHIRDDKVLESSVIQAKNSRSILIHGTPKRLPVVMHDMKENTPATKRLPKADATAYKPSLRRKALEDIGK